MVQKNYLNEILTLLQEDLSAEKTYEMVCGLVKQAVDYESATLFIYDEKENVMNAVYQTGNILVDLLSQFDFGTGSGLSGWVSKQKEPIILPSLSKSKAGIEGRFQSLVSLPLRIGERLIGVMNLGHSKSGVFKQEKIEDYSLIGTKISLVIEQVQLRKNLSEQNSILKKTLIDLQTTQKELVEKERLAAIGDIVVTVNHEINNPLASIMGLTELLSFSVHTLSPDKVTDSLNMILKEAKRIQKITEKLRNIKSSKSDKYVGDIKMTPLPK